MLYVKSHIFCEGDPTLSRVVNISAVEAGGCRTGWAFYTTVQNNTIRIAARKWFSNRFTWSAA